jgi:hypothetical protein
MTDDDSTPSPVSGVLDALRDGWHGLGGGDATQCPGCPVCRLSESAGRMDPQTSEHLQAAVAHLVSAGRELLAALSAPGPVPADDRSHTEAAGPTDARGADPAGPPPPARTRIPVTPATTSPGEGDEEQA